jgi:hypothetical protein
LVSPSTRHIRHISSLWLLPRFLSSPIPFNISPLYSVPCSRPDLYHALRLGSIQPQSHAPLTSHRGGQGVVSVPSTSRAPSGTASARGTTRTPLGGAGGAPRAVSAASSAQLQQLTAQVAEMQAMCESVEKERDFYFDSESRRGEMARNDSDRLGLEGCLCSFQSDGRAKNEGEVCICRKSSGSTAVGCG